MKYPAQNDNNPMVTISKLNLLCLMAISLHRFQRLDEFIIGSSTILICGLSIEYEMDLSFDLRSTIYQLFSDVCVHFWFEIEHKYTFRMMGLIIHGSISIITVIYVYRIYEIQWLIHKYLYWCEKVSVQTICIGNIHWTPNNFQSHQFNRNCRMRYTKARFNVNTYNI